jgi:hypothetical protein
MLIGLDTPEHAREPSLQGAHSLIGTCPGLGAHAHAVHERRPHALTVVVHDGEAEHAVMGNPPDVEPKRNSTGVAEASVLLSAIVAIIVLFVTMSKCAS